MPVTDLGDTDGWTAEPVDFDPFAGSSTSVPDSDQDRQRVAAFAANPFMSDTNRSLLPHGLGALILPRRNFADEHLQRQREGLEEPGQLRPPD